MVLNDFLKNEKISQYRLSKESGIAMATISDICSGRSELDKCTAGTLYKIAKVLGVTVDLLLENHYGSDADYRYSFETFRGNTCRRLKDLGDMNFIIETLESDRIRAFYNRQWERESLYLLAMIDYLSRINGFPLCNHYEDIRSQKLEGLQFPASIMEAYAATGDESIREQAIAHSIPEFMRFHIVENEVRNVG